MHTKTILITGSGSGIGRATALELAQRGHTVWATTHLSASADELNQVAKDKKLPLKSFVLDVTNEKDREKILEYDIDVLINNAGMGETGSLAEIPLSKIKNNFEVNLFGALALTQLALRNMLKKDAGTVIFISSLLGRTTAPFFGSYSMTKFALSSGAEMLQSELSQITDKVRAVVVEPGAYHTGFNQKMIAKKYEWMDSTSYFYAIRNQLKKREERQFRLAEVKNLTSIVTQIVSAAEAEKPRFRWTAPWWQASGVFLLRLMGR